MDDQRATRVPLRAVARALQGYPAVDGAAGPSAQRVCAATFAAVHQHDVFGARAALESVRYT